MNPPWLSVRIVARRQETAEIVVLDLAAEDGAALPDFAAGAHIDVEIRPGLVRQYSLCALPAGDGRYRIGVLRDPASRGGSVALHGLDVGAPLRIGAPRNQFTLAPGAHETLLLAGGIGVTPLLCMAEALHRDARSFSLHYCARSAARAAFLPLLAAAPYAARVRRYFDDGADTQRLDIAAVLAGAAPGSHLYVCGPGGFMAWVLEAAERAAWPAARVHREYFKAEPIVQPAGDRAFHIRLARSGRVLEVPADRSIVAVLRAHGVELPISCEAGVCGTCLTGVLAGEPDHRDLYLTAAEHDRGDQMLPCCSRARSDLLVLDL
jgi:vanillate O-demethylase ferredoxin subunit